MTRRVLVTGASRGIGKEIMGRLTVSGHRCIGASRSIPRGEGEFEMVQGDQTDPGEARRLVDQAVDRMGGLDALILNAGAIDDGLAMSLDPARFDALVRTNLVGTYNVLHAALRTLMRIRDGRIVFISSTAAFTGGIGQSNYAASKAGLVGLARSVAREVGRRGTTVNVVAPGLIQSSMSESLSEQVREDYRTNVPLQRLGTGAEVADAVEFLVSDRASYITGSVLTVDGGYSMGF